MKESKKIILIGGGGHCKSVLDSLSGVSDYSRIGIVDKNMQEDSEFMSHPVLGNDEKLDELFRQGYKYAFITLGSIGDSSLREKLYKKVVSIGFEIPNIVDTTAIVSKHSKMGNGNFVGKGAIINTDVTLGDCNIINSGVIIEHDCRVGSFTHIAPGSILSGNVFVGSKTHIGSNTTIKQGLSVGHNTIVGMGSVVVKEILDNKIAYGNPCREVRER